MELYCDAGWAANGMRSCDQTSNGPCMFWFCSRGKKEEPEWPDVKLLSWLIRWAREECEATGTWHVMGGCD